MSAVIVLGVLFLIGFGLIYKGRMTENWVMFGIGCVFVSAVGSVTADILMEAAKL